VLKHLQSREDWSEKSLGAKGFTLIELLVVIIILGVLAGVAIFAVGSINDRAATNACKTERDTLEAAAEAWKAQTDAYPASAAVLVSGQGSVEPQLKKEPVYWTWNGTAAVRTSKAANDCP
jgi:prepilin-type N-terminal cleavage/methylation domain-containing protein